jgi:glycosyltransferase involved in cell wall biosynthesis
MKILIDLTSLARKITGIERYSLSLSEEIVKKDNKNQYVLIFRKNIHNFFSSIQKSNVSCCCSPFKSQLLTEQVYLPYVILRLSPDISFFPAFPPGFFAGFFHFTYMCHDAVMWKFPETLSIKNKLYFRPLAERACKKAQYIFTNSLFSKTDLISVFPKYKNKIIVLGGGVQKKFFKKKNTEISTVLTEYKINKKYLLITGSLEPRKNLPFVFNNIGNILRKHSLLLVVVGRQAWGEKTVVDAIKKNDLVDYVILPGYVSNNHLQCLYSGAEAFLFPSLCEGFGFPILEAFACECPVITSNVSSMPEVAGDAALLIDPRNGKMLIDAIECILKYQDLKNDLVKRGKERLKQFSWENSANLCINAICK